MLVMSRPSQKSLWPDLDDGTAMQSVDMPVCIDSYMALAAGADGTFIKDFWRCPECFFVNKTKFSDYLTEKKYTQNAGSIWRDGKAEKVGEEAKKKIFKDLVESQNAQIDKGLPDAFINQWNQNYLYPSNLLPNCLSFIANPVAFFDNESFNQLAKFDQNGDYTVHVIPFDHEIKIEIKKKLSYEIGAAKEIRSLSDCTQTLIFKNVAASGSAAPCYAVSHHSTEFSNPKVKTLLEKPYANRDYHLQRKLLCEMRKPAQEDDPNFDAMIKFFDEKVIGAVENTQNCGHMNLTGVNLSGLNLSNKDFTNANLTGVNLTGVKLDRQQVEQILKGGRKDLSGVNLSGVNLSGVNLSGVDLSGVDLSGVNLSGVNLSGVKINNKTILMGATLPRDKFTVKYYGAEIEPEDMGKIFNLLYLEKKYAVRRFKSKDILSQDIFSLVRYIQENPAQHFSKAAKHELFLTATRKLIAALKLAPAEKTDADSAAADLDGWVKAVENKGLHAPEISQVIRYLKMCAQGQSVRRQGFTVAELDKDPISFGLFEQNDRTVIINVEQTLSEKEKGACFIAPLHFAALIANSSRMKNAEGTQKKIDCIQMPLADGDHYMQLQIYKMITGGIGARVIDSTASPLHDPTDFVRKLLIDNREQLKTVLGATSSTVTVSEVVSTKEQLLLGDKEKRGIYVAAGMKATAEKVLAEGAGFLSDDTQAKDAVRHQHHLVSKTEPMGYLMGMNTSLVAWPDVAESTASVSSGTEQSMNTVSASAASASAAAPAAAAAAASEPLLPGQRCPLNRSNTKLNVEQQAKSTTPSAYSVIITLLNDKLDAAKLKTAVDLALESYSKKNTGRFNLHFFRQFSSAGRDYAADAKARIVAAKDDKAQQTVAREIAHEILFMGVQPDGKTIEVKHNSRVHHLLMAMQGEQKNATRGIARNSTSALINPPTGIDFTSLGVMGCSFEAKSLIFAATKTSSTHSQSDHSFNSGD